MSNGGGPRGGGTLSWRDLATADPDALRAAGITRDDASIILGHADTILPTDEAFNVSHFIVLPSPGVNVPVAGFQLRPGLLGIVRWVAMQTVVPGFMNAIRWAIRMNGSPIPGFDRIEGFFGTYLLPAPVSIPLFPNALIEIVATNLSGGPIPNVHGAFRGQTFAAGAP